MPKAPSAMTDEEIDDVLSALGENTSADFRASDLEATAPRTEGRGTESRRSSPPPAAGRRPPPLAPPKSIPAPAMSSPAMSSRRGDAPSMKAAPMSRRGLVVPSPLPSSPAMSSRSVPASPMSSGALPSLAMSTPDDEHTNYRPQRTGPQSLRAESLRSEGMMSDHHMHAEREIKATLASFADSRANSVRAGSTGPVSVRPSSRALSSVPPARISTRAMQPGSLHSLSPRSMRPNGPISMGPMSTGQLDIPPTELSSPRVRVGGRSTSSWAAAFVAVGAFTGVLAGFVFRGEAAEHAAASLVEGPRTTSALVAPMKASETITPAAMAPAAMPANIDLGTARAQTQPMFAVAPIGESKALANLPSAEAKPAAVAPVAVAPVAAAPVAVAPVAAPEPKKAAPVVAAARPVYRAPAKAEPKEAPAPKPVAAKSNDMESSDSLTGETARTEKKARKKVNSAQSEADRLAAEQLEQSL